MRYTQNLWVSSNTRLYFTVANKRSFFKSCEIVKVTQTVTHKTQLHNYMLTTVMMKKTFLNEAQYCWFLCDVKAAMSVVKNKNISLLREVYSIFHVNSQRKNYTRAALLHSCNPRMVKERLNLAILFWFWSSMIFCGNKIFAKFANQVRLNYFIRSSYALDSSVLSNLK